MMRLHFYNKHDKEMCVSKIKVFSFDFDINIQ